MLFNFILIFFQWEGRSAPPPGLYGIPAAQANCKLGIVENCALFWAKLVGLHTWLCEKYLLDICWMVGV